MQKMPLEIGEMLESGMSQGGVPARLGSEEFYLFPQPMSASSERLERRRISDAS